MGLPGFGPLGSPTGKATALFEFHPSFTLFEEYTDNFFRSARDRQTNWRTGAGANLTTYINGAFTKGTIATSFSASHDTIADTETNLFPSILGRIEWEATPRLSFAVTDTLTRSDEPARADRLGLRQQRNEFTSNVFEAEANWTIDQFRTREYYRLATFQESGGNDTTSHALGASASTRIGASNTGALSYEYLDSKTTGSSRDSTTHGHQLTASFSRQLTPFTNAGVSGGYNYRTFTDRGTEDNFQTFNVSLFNNYVIPGRWSLAGNVGFSRILDDRGRTFDSVSTTSTFTYSFARALLTLSLDRGFSETFTLGEDFGVVETQGVTASLSYPFTPLISGYGSVYYRDNKSTGIGGGRSDFNAETYGGQLSLSYRLLSWLTLALEYAYSHEKAADGSKIIENRGRASLTAGF